MYHQKPIPTSAAATRVMSTGCQAERDAWQEADQDATQSLIARGQARSTQEQAAADLEAARAALTAAEQANAEAVAAVAAAQQEVDRATEAAGEAYAAYLQCIR
jgi:hypothetical protein